MATLPKTKDGKVDKRTKEYKELCERMARARKAAAKASALAKKVSSSGVKRNSDGTIDKRTKEGKAISERMAKARAAKDAKANSLSARLSRLFGR